MFIKQHRTGQADYPGDLFWFRSPTLQLPARGIGTIMDMIVNHIGSEHWWMADLPTDDWLNFQSNPRITSHEHITEQDPYASAHDTRLYSDGWFVYTHEQGYEGGVELVFNNSGNTWDNNEEQNYYTEPDVRTSIDVFGTYALFALDYRIAT